MSSPLPSAAGARPRRRTPFQLLWLGAATAGTLLVLASCEEGNPLFPDSGSVEVTVQGGAQPPAGYTVTLDGDRTRSISQVPGTTTFNDVASGQHQVQLSGFAQGCSALSNPRNVNVSAGATARTTFVVAC